MKKHKRYYCLEENLAKATAASYRKSVDVFWVWARITGKYPKPIYPIPNSLLHAYVLARLNGLPRSVVKRLNRAGVFVTGKRLAHASISRAMWAIRVEHIARNLPDPTTNSSIRLTLSRANNRLARFQNRKRPLTKDLLKLLLDQCGDDLRGKRDRAILLVAFASGGRRRSELARLRVEDLSKVPDGYIGTLKLHKTVHWSGKPLVFPIYGQAAKALRVWLKAAAIEEGKVFRGIHRSGYIYGSMGARTVNRVVKRLSFKAGLPPEHYGAHSLRSGFVTQALNEGIAAQHVMQLSGHRSIVNFTNYFWGSHPHENRAAWVGARF